MLDEEEPEEEEEEPHSGAQEDVAELFLSSDTTGIHEQACVTLLVRRTFVTDPLLV